MRGILFGLPLFAVLSAGAALSADDPHESHASHSEQPGQSPQDSDDDMSGMDMPGMEHHEAPAAETHPAAHDMNSMPGMERMDMPMTGILGSYPMTRDASGTGWQPEAAPHMGIHWMSGDWSMMGHLRLTGVYDTQSGPRGDDKTFLEGMGMLMARRDFADGDALNLRAMLSPDPFMGKSGYPLLFASGETANGTAPLIDRQHPHDLFMELSATYMHPLSEHDSVFLYAGYPGEPALGPPAFMHRASGMDIPSAPITHHWLDSTHIVFGVVTAGWVHDDWKIEVSQFTGREPNEERFDFDPIKLDSTSVRLTWNPDAHWSLQASWGSIHSPEQLEPDVNEDRFTASATYVTRIGNEGSFAATLAWGLKQESPGPDLNGLLAEAEYKPSDPLTLYARAEWEENAELVPSSGVVRVSTIAFGAIRDFQVAEHLKVGIGAQYAFDFAQSKLDPVYGSDPHGAMVFVRLIAE